MTDYVNIAHLNRKRLEAAGEYVVQANIDWFAVFPRRLEICREKATSQGRADFHFVIYRDKSRDPRHHYVVPASKLASLLIPSSLSDSSDKGKVVKRWNLVLASTTERLRVTHLRDEVDLAPFRGAPLIIEFEANADFPTTDRSELDRRVFQLLRNGAVTRPVGVATPARKASGGTEFQRSPLVKAWVLQNAAGVCELCSSRAPFVGDNGQPYIEHHHVVPLAEGGPDTVENSVAVCPNCHRELHLARDREARREHLYSSVHRLRRHVSALRPP